VAAVVTLALDSEPWRRGDGLTKWTR